jgi:hypothetical protein
VRFRHTTLVPERTADGSIGSIVLFAYDLTALKNAQAEALQQKPCSAACSRPCRTWCS